jgi:hypothetical protein
MELDVCTYRIVASLHQCIRHAICRCPLEWGLRFVAYLVAVLQPTAALGKKGAPCLV